tara:strand:+ start:2494 stop:3252 length:759 start_codon:yes stop_codon:yes gene_type:complete
MLSKFDKILLDVSGTLYSNKKEPLNGSKEFLKKYYKKIIIFSNIGSKTGVELKEELFSIFNVPIPNVITSLDLLLKFLEKKSYKTIFHYGQENVANKIKPFVGNIVNDISEENIDAIIFTSLVGSDWIKRTESALNLIIKTDADILLGNPDRISPEPPFNFTVTLILDSLLNLSDVLQKKKLSKEFGKPNLSRKMIKVKKEDKLIVIGDNPWTDIEVSKNLKCQSVLISSKSYLVKNSPLHTFSVESLKEIL